VASVLVVDDDATVREVVATYLRANHHEVFEAADGESAIKAMETNPSDLLVLDLMLPGLGGLEVCQRIRQISEVPIIMLTALGSETDRVVGLQLAADEYVTKPFSPRELALRVESVLRRTSGRAPELADVLTDGDLVIDHPHRTVSRGGEKLSLTVREYDLLRFLMGHPEVTFSREELLERVWGWSFGDRTTVTVHVRRLREKVEDDPTHPARLLTVWGVGYLWQGSP
jgi:DNA-binding response OmpR family regulator